MTTDFRLRYREGHRNQSSGGGSKEVEYRNPPHKTGPKSKSLPKIEKIKAMHTDGFTDGQMAEAIGCKKDNVAYFRKSMGLVINRRYPCMDGDNAVCLLCRETKPSIEFKIFQKGRSKPTKFTICKPCRRLRTKLTINASIESYLTYIANGLRKRCKAKGTFCDVSATLLFDLWQKQKGSCFYTDVEMVAIRESGYNKDRVTIDRIIPSVGYAKNNIVLCRYRINSMKGDATLEEMSLWMPDWYRRLESLGFSKELYRRNDEGRVQFKVA